MVTFSIILKALFYCSALICLGLALQSAMGLYSRGRLLILMAFLFTGLIVLRFVSLNAVAAGSWSEAFSPASFKWIWLANAHQTYAFGIGLSGLILGAFLKSNFIKRSLLGLSACLIAIGFGLAGHTRSLDHPGVFPALAMGHVLIAGFWITAPITLFPRADISDAALLDRVKGFSSFALWLIPLLFVSGIWLLLTISGSFKGVFTQTYGWILLLKLFVATGLLALGAYNKLRVTKRLAETSQAGRRALRKTLITEAILFSIIIVLITLVTTVFTPAQG